MKRANDRIRRCAWSLGSELEMEYHDCEWGVPSYDDRHLFEMLLLEGAQAGLSWSTVLAKRESYRKAYAGFEPEKIARFGKRKREQLLRNPGIVRNRLKVESSVGNAKAFLAVCEEYGSFSKFIWGFVDGSPIVPRRRRPADVPAQTPESVAMSKALRLRGFRFVGPTICYAFMQATGMVNDHTVDCFRHAEV